MFSAFDTIHPDKIIQIAEEILDNDEKKILRVLLSDTTLEVKVNGAETTSFESNIGSPQGDSINGPLFTIYFQNALKQIRQTIEEDPIDVRDINRSWIERMNSEIPKEMIYTNTTAVTL